MKKFFLVALVAAAGLVGAYAFAQTQGTAVILPPAGNMTTSVGPVSLPAASDHGVHVNTLANDTFVVVKDVTDSQIVMVYRVDQLGKVTLADKKRFYY